MRRVIRAPCPSCEKEIIFEYITEEIPYFPDILIVSATCDCGFRYTDTMILGEGEPARWILQVEETGDLNARVVRSTTGSIEIPELGFLVEPGPACEAFITNVEGVLVRFENVLERIIGWGTEDERKEAFARKDQLSAARKAEIPFTLIIEDPDGNSAILSPKAKKELLNFERKGE